MERCAVMEGEAVEGTRPLLATDGKAGGGSNDWARREGSGGWMEGLDDAAPERGLGEEEANPQDVAVDGVCSVTSESALTSS